MNRTKKVRHLASARPRLHKVDGMWHCSDGVIKSTGHSFQGAYEKWLTKAIADAMKQVGVADYKGEVTVVKGVQARPALKLPQALQINAERARAAQGPLRSLSGIREVLV